ncbi:hypothetical protein Npun_R2849 [Nostoc punctiforme PCC 73102]|uniref:DUF4332 domain-containing protein n=2 Tax=Nostoc punctiforme TaxID=272131 RepID=B2IVJ7_NOSP7|nr:hypothetical protein Npun_R2849 [Nostoc punctiforme PCC 73102]
MALSGDTMALSGDTIALSGDAMALPVKTITLSGDAMALLVDAITLSVDAMAIFSFKMSTKNTNNRNLLASRDWPIEQLPGLSHDEQSQLQNCGIDTTVALVKQGKTLEARLALANKLQIHLQYVNKWIALADLARIPSVGIQYCGLLLHAGIGSVAQLAQTPTHRLHQQIMRLQVATMQRRDLCPAIELVQQWSQQAQAIR